MSSPCAPRSTGRLQEPTPDIFSSSPPTATTGSRKQRRPPPITPKRFSRFFTPRNTREASSRTAPSRSSRKLQDITRAAINHPRAAPRTTPRKTVNFADVENVVSTPQSSSRKRKTAYLSPETSPVQSSPSKRSRYVTPPFDIFEDGPVPVASPIFPAPIRRIRTLGGASRTLQRSFGGILSVGRGFKRDHCTSWQDQTANFYSSPDDVHELSQRATPFCTASCNTNSLLATGDEDGYIHILNSEGDFSNAHLSWRAHSNAVMDLQFSPDDSYLAAGSGDQTAQIVDVRTQQTLSVLAKHRSSVKQVRFQPGDDKIIATSSRDGAVQIWDLRCKGQVSRHSAWGSDAPYAHVIHTLASAHSDSRNETSITSLSFLPEGRQHLLMTASDASTCVKLWDIRGRYTLRGPAVPISTTRHTEAHLQHRHFAISSLTLNSNASRLYALCKDNTIYAYSTSNLILGAAPELAPDSFSKQKYGRANQEGLGPMYGFRHPKLHAGSFYVKTSLRKARHDQPELLAVGSTDGGPVLFPTDETFLKRESKHHEDETDLPGMVTRSTLQNMMTNSRCPDSIPIYEQGTSLIRGHSAEVTSVCWATNGSLVSVSDDLCVRRWKEGREARELRLGGEGEGKRWHCGWADVQQGYDDDDDV